MNRTATLTIASAVAALALTGCSGDNTNTTAPASTMSTPGAQATNTPVTNTPTDAPETATVEAPKAPIEAIPTEISDFINATWASDDLFAGALTLKDINSEWADTVAVTGKARDYILTPSTKRDLTFAPALPVSEGTAGMDAVTYTVATSDPKRLKDGNSRVDANVAAVYTYTNTKGVEVAMEGTSVWEFILQPSTTDGNSNQWWIVSYNATTDFTAPQPVK